MRGSSQPLDMPIPNQLQQLALAHHRVGQIEAGKLDLLGMIDVQLIEKPVVQRAMVFKLQRADGVGDAFDGVALAVRPVVHRVDAPLVAGAVMVGVEDAVHDRVAQIEVAARSYQFWPAGHAPRREIRPPACVGTDLGSLQPNGCGRGYLCPARSKCPDRRGFPRR